MIVHKAKDLDVKGKIVAIVDDMIATGGTISRRRRARSQGAVEVHAACSHGLFTGGAIRRLTHMSTAFTLLGAYPTLARSSMLVKHWHVESTNFLVTEPFCLYNNRALHLYGRVLAQRIPHEDDSNEWQA